MNNLKPEDSLVASLSTDLGGVGIDLAEIGVDAVLNDGVLKDIPVLSTLVGIYKAGVSIRERQYIKKLILFLSEFKKIDEDGRKRFVNSELSDEKKREKFGETILALIEKSDDSKKLKIYARIFEQHILDQCSYDDAVRVSLMIERSFYSDLTYLLEFEDGSFDNQITAGELYKNGFLSFSGMDAGSLDDDPNPGGIVYTINKYGELAKSILKRTV
jgi:hypothetical protein